MAVDNSYYGAGTYGQQTYNVYDVLPDPVTNIEAAGSPAVSTSTTATPASLNDPETVGAPSGTTAASTSPGSVGDPETLAGPSSSTAVTSSPGSAGDPESVGAPTANVSATTTPSSIAETQTLGSPSSTFTITATPNSLADASTVGSPASAGSGTVIPASINDPETIGAPSGSTASTTAPTAVTDAQAVGGPTLATTAGASPDGAADVETVGGPTVTVALTVTPSITADPDAVGAPVVSASTDAAPAAIADVASLGAPTATFSQTVTPNTVNTPETFGGAILGANSTTAIYGPGDYGSGLYVGGVPATVAPLGINDPQTVPAAEVNFANETSNFGYSDGAYGKGVYFGEPTPTTPLPDNNTYGGGTYNLGRYVGIALPAPDPSPLFPYEDPLVRVPLHVLGLGPWSPFALWRGAPNYGVPAGKYDAAPAMILPNAQSKGFTLRLDDGSEARADYSFTRNSAVIFEDMVTDLWWRRKDGITGTVDMIGRFNTSNVAVSADDTGLKVSAQFESYKSVLGHKLVLDYKDRTNAESMWAKGTLITDILRFAIPTNTRMDLSLIAADTAYALGTITQPFTLPPGTLVSDMMDNLLAISPKPWEWWVETPDAFGSAPKLRFVVGQRGSNKDVTLFDTGSGSTNLAAWTLTGIADTYANALYYTGGTGGVYEVIDDEIAQYGERDTQDGNSSLGGDIVLIRNAAQKKLRALADHRPTFQVTLKTGFWRGRSHIDIGDTVHLRIKLGAELIAHDYRVTEIAVDIDGNGLETVRLTLGTPLAATDPRSKRSALVRIVRYLKNYTAPAGSDSTTGTTDPNP